MATATEAEGIESPFPLTAVDRSVLAMTDDEFHPQSWEDLKQIIGTATPIICDL